jgi:hypothetical protein
MIRNKAETFNDGIVRIYSTGNVAEPGKMPVEGVTPKETLRFRERTVGNQRYFQGLQASVNINRLIRCNQRRNVSPHDLVEIQDNRDGTVLRYRIEQVQYPENMDVKVMDLALSRNDWRGADV